MEKGRIVRRRSALSKIPLKRRLFGVRGVASDVRSVGGVVGSVRGVVGSVGGVFDNVLNNSVRSVRGLVSRLLTASRAEIGRAHVCTPVTYEHLVCSRLLVTKNILSLNTTQFC